MADAGRTVGATVGAVLAGLGITALIMRGEAAGGEASEMTVLGRATARRLGLDAPRGTRAPEAAEQMVVQGGHLALSALAGPACVAAFDEDASVLPSGVLFGLAFYVLAHVVTGPLLGVKASEWRQPPGTVPRHAAIHVVFGLAIALGARLSARASARS